MFKFISQLLVLALCLTSAHPASATKSDDVVGLSPIQVRVLNLQTIILEIDDLYKQIAETRSTRNEIVTIALGSAAVSGFVAAMGYKALKITPWSRRAKIFGHASGVLVVSTATAGLAFYIENDKIDGFLSELKAARGREAATLDALYELGGEPKGSAIEHGK